MAMMWKNWNKADKTLLAAAAIFCFALCLNIQYKDNVYAKGFLFCAEAALVGGIADWFAVTALFEKPLGFPWHTAILPRRRQSFIEATGRMLQQEFFGRKSLIKKIRRIDFANMVVAWLGRAQTKQMLSGWLLNRLPLWLSKHDRLPDGALSRSSAFEFKAESLRPISDYAIRGFYDFAKNPEFYQRVKNGLEEYVDSKLQGPMAIMMAGFAQSANIINVDEAAELIQKKTILLVERVQQENTAEYAQVQESLGKIFDFYEKNLLIKQELNDVLLNNAKSWDVCERLLNQNGQMDAFIEKNLVQLIEELLERAEALLSNNKTLQEELNSLIYQMAARGALQAQDLLGSITNDVLGTMTDQQINRLVYDKAEPDLLWIRMNGSIVGASIGLVVFVGMQFV